MSATHWSRRSVVGYAASAVAGLGIAAAAAAQDKTKKEKKDKKSKSGALRFEIYKDNAGEFRWRLKAANGQVIATGGQGYKAKADVRHAIDVIQKGAASAKVEDAE